MDCLHRNDICEVNYESGQKYKKVPKKSGEGAHGNEAKPPKT